MKKNIELHSIGKDDNTLYIHRDESGHLNKRIFFGIIAALFVIFIIIGYATSGAVTGISVSALVENQEKYHRKKVAVVGTVESVTEKKSIRGNIYYTTRLTDGKNHVNIFSFGNPKIHDGQYIRAIGFYTQIKYLEPWTFENELDLTYGNIYDISDYRNNSFAAYFHGLLQRFKSNNKLEIPAI